MQPQSRVANHLIGTIVREYQIERQLGQSPINTVYIARSPKQDQAVMFTTFTLPDRFSTQAYERFKDRFIRVVSALAHLRHPLILPVYDFCAQPGYLYMVTPLTTADTLATSLQRQSRFTTAQVLEIMRQIAEGVDYAHRSGVVHGLLKSENILLDREQKVQIAGFGLVQLLALSGVEQFQHPYAHLLSVALTFLGDPFTIAPEVVQGMPIAAEADVYALGILLFELLSGKPPFAETDPLKTALARLQKPVPSILELRPDLPPSLDLVLQRALERDPALRYPSAGSLVVAFGQALRGGDTAKQVAVTAKQNVVLPTEDKESAYDRTWGGDTHIANGGTGIGQYTLQDQPMTGAPSAFAQPSLPQEMSAESLSAPDEEAIDPFVWWSTASLPAEDGQTFSAATGAPTYQPPTPVKPLASRSSVNKKRRRMVAALVTGGIVVSGLGAGGIALAHMLQGAPKAQSNVAQSSATPTSQPVVATKTVQPSPTAKATEKPKATPTPKPSPTPSHTGTVIGSTNQGVGSATTFVNPLDGAGSLLIRLSSGAFVAFESACTHEGVTCYYNAGIGRIVCPRHNALFDPYNNAAILKGPPPRPLPSVPVHVNEDGTITVG